MTRRHSLVPACLAIALLSSAAAASAQSPAAPQAPRARSAASIADSLAAHGDSTRALAVLDSAVRQNPRDGAAWNRIGVLNLAIVGTRRNAAFIKDQKDVRRLLAADSALRLATQYAPDSSQYWLDLMHYSLASGYASVRLASDGQSAKALQAAERSGDSIRIAIAADEHGLAAWRRYESQGNRALPLNGQTIDVTSMNENFSGGHIKEYLESIARKIEPPTGTGDFNAAYADFRRATLADPTSLRASRHVFMALAEKGRWPELRDEAIRRTRLSSFDYQAWLALGLASHRLGQEKAASTAFDSAFARLDDDARERYERLTRILRPAAIKSDKKSRSAKDAALGDSANYAKMSETGRRGLSSVYWMLADPLAVTPENELKLEFLSRVTFAELRWTNEDFNLHGADTDRGDIHVRYGPPDQEMTLGGTSEGVSGGVTIAWAYNNGLLFFFDAPPGYGTARVAFSDRDNVDRMKAAVPVSWTNMPVTRLMDTISVRTARFRAGGDSLDVVVAAGIPMDSLVHGLKDVDRLPVDIDIRVYDEHAITHGVESVQSSVRLDSASSAARRNWTRRVGPGTNVVRIEAVQMDSKRAARAVTIVNADATKGFGMSDLLLGGRTDQKGDAAQHWSDVDMAPGMGVYGAGTPVGLVWEIYDLMPQDGTAKYQVRIGVEPVERKGGVGFAVRLLGGVGQALGRDARNKGRLTAAFPKTVAARSTVVDHMTLDLSQSPPGEYVLTLEITDLVAKKLTSRTTKFSIHP